MPFESKSQQRWMFAKHPEMAERWAEHTPDIKSLPEKKKKDKHEKKALFIDGFIQSFYNKLGMSKEAVAASPRILAAMVKLSEVKFSLEKKAIDPKSMIEVMPDGTTRFPVGLLDKPIGSSLSNLAMAVGAPFVTGSLAGAGLARLLGPSQHDVSNLQKHELLTQYDNAIAEMKRRIATRRG